MPISPAIPLSPSISLVNHVTLPQHEYSFNVLICKLVLHTIPLRGGRKMKTFILLAAAVLVIATGINLTATLINTKNIQMETPEEIPEEEIDPGPSRAEVVINALAAAYPSRIETVEFRDDDWALLMDDIWYFYAGGRMLPADELGNYDAYSGSFIIYNYPEDLPVWVEPSTEQAERYQNRGNVQNSGRTQIQRQRSNHFFEGLWQMTNHDESYRRQKTIKLFGFSVPVHEDMIPVFTAVEETVLSLAENDKEVLTWVNGIGEVHGWYWRNISGSQSRSYHSYGIVVDILPKSTGGKEMYWQWAAQNGKDWRYVSYDDRFHPPDPVVKTFESYGFVWGGKWAWYDTMHFEYRPEVFILNGLDILIL